MCIVPSKASNRVVVGVEVDVGVVVGIGVGIGVGVAVGIGVGIASKVALTLACTVASISGSSVDEHARRESIIKELINEKIIFFFILNIRVNVFGKLYTL